MSHAQEGYVVVSKDGKYLSRSGRWVTHQKAGKPRPSHAWVHPTPVVLAGGQWAKEAGQIIPAHYDPSQDTTVIDGPVQGFGA